jgi:predicted AlkP superfamily pyrophosphatase or phosphodiesterase
MTRRLAILVALLLLPSALVPAPVAQQPANQDGRPRLVVLLVFDQFRGDYLDRWGHLFGEGGLKRLTAEGAWFKNCHYDYAFTFTAPGHASLATGCGPDQHGIVGNEWYDRSAREVISSVQSERYQPVPLPPPKKGKENERVLGAWPGRRLQPTVADILREMHKGKCRVVSLSLKDRSAILLAALLADLCFWFSNGQGQFVTSTYYPEPPGWVNEFNRGRPADGWFGKDWTPLRGDLNYTRLSGNPDNGPGESKGYEQGTTFPHPTTGGLKAPGTKFYEAVTTSPYGNDLLLAFARRAIDAEKLGQREAPDLLCVSFSSNDLIGHMWGPDSHEVLDATLRTDRLVKDLLDHLDARVGKGKYAVVLSADHGICPNPEVARARGLDAGRVVPRELEKAMNDFLDRQYGKPSGKAAYVEKFVPPWIYLDHRVLEARKLYAADVERALAKWLPRQPGIQAAYTRDQLSRGPLKNDPIGEKVRRSYYPGRSGEVAVVTRPFWLLTKYVDGTTHGAPYEYDTHVPLLAYGPGVRAAAYDEAVSPKAAAPILSHLLGIPPPAGAEVGLPSSLTK